MPERFQSEYSKTVVYSTVLHPTNQLCAVRTHVAFTVLATMVWYFKAHVYTGEIQVTHGIPWNESLIPWYTTRVALHS